MLDSLTAILDTEQARLIIKIAGGTLLLGLVATAFAYASYWKTRTSWAKAEGRIRNSAPGFKLVQRFQTEAPRNERVASIAYEFKVNGKTWVSGKILDTGDPAEDDVDRLLTDYPAGKAVTVLYDPRDPRRSALEINAPPRDLAKGCLATALILIVVAVLAIWFTTVGIRQIETVLPNALVPAMLITLLVGLGFLAVALSLRRQAAAIRRWPQATGTVVLSRVEEFTVRRDKAQRTSRGMRRMRTAFMPVVEYTYSVGGRDYSSRSIWADTEVSGDQSYAEKMAARYQPGQIVMVHYDPAAPKRAALETSSSWYWFLVPAAIALGFAAVTSGLFW